MLRTAILTHKCTKITYAASSMHNTTRIIYPLKLAYKGQAWYLKSYCTAKQDFRLFKPSFVPEQTVTLCFPGEMAYRVYDEFDLEQVTLQTNGTLLVSAKMPVETDSHRNKHYNLRKEGITMSRPTTKPELLNASEENYEQMNLLIAGLSEKELSTPFDFSADVKKKEAHWNRDKNLRDVLIHLYEWHQLLLHWVHVNQAGTAAPFLPRPYNWKTYGKMNEVFWQNHQNTTLEEAKDMLDKSHQEVMQLAETFTDEELFRKGIFPWVGNSPLGSYFVSATASHYVWAMKKLKAHKKNCKAD